MIKLDEFGLWYDAPRPTGDYISKAKKLAKHFDTVSISLNAGTGNVCLPTWNKKSLEYFTKALNDEGVVTRWMIYPKWRYINETLNALKPLYAFMGDNPPVPDLDLEENAHGFNTRTSGLLLDGLSQFSEVGVAVNFVPTAKGVVPGFVQPFIDNEIVMLAYLQAYLQYQKNVKWTHDRIFRPDGAYLETCDKVAQNIERPGLLVGLGMALHGQNHPSPSLKGADALNYTLNRLKNKERPISCWSSKHINWAWLESLAR